MEKFDLLMNFLESIKITDENRIIMEGIKEAFESVRNQMFARDVNPDTAYKGLYYGFTKNDKNIPKSARKKYGVIMPPDFTSSTGFDSGGNSSMNSYAAGGGPGIS